MKILYDGEVYTSQATGGINRYFANIISRLPSDFYPTLTTASIRDKNFPKHKNLRTFFYPRHGFRPGRVSYWLEKYYFRLVSSLQYDIIHPTYYWILPRHELEKCRYPKVITVHDMVHELFPNLIDPAGYVVNEKRKAILSASAIICDSENTKKDLLSLYPISEDKVFVVYLASEINHKMSYGKEEIPSRPYFLFVGGRLGYKNFELLIKAFTKITTFFPDISLCIAGKPLSSSENALISALNLNQYIEHFAYPSDQHLAKLYRCSLALVYPSLYEGFGLPLLEAMACRTVAIASNTSSIPEVVEDAGLLFNPNSLNDLADKLLYILNNPIEREKLILKGTERLNHFSWDNTVRKTIDIYKKVA